MALHSKAHIDFHRSAASSARHAPPKRTKSKWAIEELVLWGVLVVAAVVLVSTLLVRAC
jgi:hypothetical protein